MQVQLNNGRLMPTVGFGTAGLGDDTSQAVQGALETGYRLFDSAQVENPPMLEKHFKLA